MTLRWSGLIVVVAASALSGASLAAQAAPTARTCPVVTIGPDVDAIRILEMRGAAVNVSGWVAEEARAFFAPEWVSVQPDGSVTKVEQVLAGFRNGRSVAWARSFALDQLDMRVFCDTAVVVGLARARPLGAPATRIIQLRYVNVGQRRDGRWLYTANQFERF